ncbi:MAG: hypothetical protein RIC03_06875 [Cyclobacteriaceae bacterium]
MKYLTYQLAIIPEPENLAVIERIKKMSYEQCQKFDIYPEPVVDDHYIIKGYRIIRNIKTK